MLALPSTQVRYWPGFCTGLGAPFYASLLGASAHLGWQVSILIPCYPHLSSLTFVCGCTLFKGPCGSKSVWQVWTVDLNNPKDCGAKFRSNRWCGIASPLLTYLEFATLETLFPPGVQECPALVADMCAHRFLGLGSCCLLASSSAS
jgi:hypothetical protein